jgi:hypothetical protein
LQTAILSRHSHLAVTFAASLYLSPHHEPTYQARNASVLDQRLEDIEVFTSGSPPGQLLVLGDLNIPLISLARHPTPSSRTSSSYRPSSHPLNPYRLAAHRLPLLHRPCDAATTSLASCSGTVGPLPNHRVLALGTLDPLDIGTHKKFDLGTSLNLLRIGAARQVSSYKPPTIDHRSRTLSPLRWHAWLQEE